LFDVIIHGALLGLILSILIGPVFFVLIETSIRRGMRDAILIDIGVILSDIIYLLMAYFSAERVIELLEQHTFLKYIGGSVLVAFGVYTIFKRQAPVQPKDLEIKKIKRPSVIGLISKGMALNAMNISVVIFWLAACTYAMESHQIEGYDIGIYFTAALSTMFAIDVLKIYSASKLKAKLTPTVLARFSVGVGLLLIFFGLVISFSNIEIPQPL